MLSYEPGEIERYGLSKARLRLILLRYMQEQDTMHRGLMVLKMRGSEHAKEIRRFTIDGHGMHLGDPFKDAPNVFTGADNEFTR